MNKKLMAALTLLLTTLAAGIIPVNAATSDAMAAYASTALVIDGEIDAVWETAETQVPTYTDDIVDDAASGYTKLLWDEDHLYLLAVVTDNTMTDPDLQETSANSVDFWISEKNTQSDTYADEGDYHICIDSSGKTHYYVGNEEVYHTMTHALQVTSDGYIIEIMVPFFTLSPAKEGHIIGYNVSINDDVDNDDNRDIFFSWQEYDSRAYWSTTLLNTVSFGQKPEPAPEPVQPETVEIQEIAPVSEQTATAPKTSGAVTGIVALTVISSAAVIGLAKKKK